MYWNYGELAETKQESPHVWPQDAYRPRCNSTHSPVRLGGGTPLLSVGYLDPVQGYLYLPGRVPPVLTLGPETGIPSRRDLGLVTGVTHPQKWPRTSDLGTSFPAEGTWVQWLGHPLEGTWNHWLGYPPPPPPSVNRYAVVLHTRAVNIILQCCF